MGYFLKLSSWRTSENSVMAKFAEFLFHAQAWPSMWGELLKRRTVNADERARKAMARSGVSRI
jgi:hypothetical protein